MTSSTADITLTSLLPSPYFLVYSIPLLLASVLVTFAGAFLTLFRTPSFAPQSPVEAFSGQYDIQVESKSKMKVWWGLEGGVGGLAIGWIFGAYLATFLSLLSMSRVSSVPLAPAVFLVIDLISSILFTFISGRFRLIALACTGVAGGVSFALILAVILHPTLLTRLIFAAILTPLTVIATLLPISRTQHRAVRVAAASTGAFGTTLSIALLAHIPPWANVWERLWMPISIMDDWGTNAERGLSAAACILLVGGVVSDWALKRTFGENPDQKWDAYLAQYAATLPHLNDRAGTFQPIRSLWEQIFHPISSTPIIFPYESALKHRPSFEGAAAHPRAIKQPRKRLDVKFQPLNGYSDSDSESESEWKGEGGYLSPQKPWVQRQSVSSTSLSGATLYDNDAGTDKGSARTKCVSSPRVTSLESYSDSEGEDITTPHSTRLKHSKSHREEPGWKPNFLSRPEHELELAAVTPVTAVTSVPPTSAVPLTPSLIRAIDRIAIAQGEAYRFNTPPPLSAIGLPRGESTDDWKRFWDRVQEKVHDP